MKEFVGWLNIYKPMNISSFEVVHKIKQKFKICKIGHCGTLDPLAEGILPIAVGKITKLIFFINDQIKSYEFEIKWGEQTITDDREGKIIQTSTFFPDKKMIENKLLNYKGEYLQKPPKASAVKINGKRAYQRLRNNDLFETKEKKVTIYNVKLIEHNNNKTSKLSIDCSKGFYVRSFARDLGESLNTKAHIYSLKRTKVGKFTTENSILLDDLLKIRQMAFGIRGLHSSMSMLDDILAFEIENEDMLKDISFGKKVQININNLPQPLNQDANQVYLAKKK